MHIVESICENLDFGVEDAKLLIQVFVVVSCMSSSMQRADTVGCSPETPIVVVSCHARAWHDGSDGCSPETPIVVVVSDGCFFETPVDVVVSIVSDGCFFETPVNVVVSGHARAWSDGNDDVGHCWCG